MPLVISWIKLRVKILAVRGQKHLPVGGMRKVLAGDPHSLEQAHNNIKFC